jgi:hypothetical protein
MNLDMHLDMALPAGASSQVDLAMKLLSRAERLR